LTVPGWVELPPQLMRKIAAKMIVKVKPTHVCQRILIGPPGRVSPYLFIASNVDAGCMLRTANSSTYVEGHGG